MNSERPNILLINVDDLGWTDCGFMGSRFYETPHIDRLAAEGTVFTRAYASAANCAPSRACMLTGLMPGRHGIYTVGSSERGDPRERKVIPAPNGLTLHDDFPTVASVLDGLGYDTGMIGKWHLSEDPMRHGFRFNVGGCHYGHPPSYFAPYGNPTVADGPDNEYLPERLAREACDFIARRRAKPFFLYYSTYLVHLPLAGKDVLVEKYRRKAAAGGATAAHYNPVYAAMIEALDQAIGSVLKTLTDSGQAGNTLVIFVSDNGGIRAVSRQNPLRGGKGSFYEGGIRVPMAVRWPGRVPAGAVNQTPVTNLDFLPTLTRAAGGNPAELRVDGVDLCRVFGGAPDPTLDKRDLFWPFPYYLEAYDPTLDEGRDPLFRTRPGAVLRRGRWKLHYFHEDDVCELYDIESDMGERRDGAAEQPQRVAEMKVGLDEMIRTLAPAVPMGPNPAYDAQHCRHRLANINQTPVPSTRSEAEWLRVMQFID